MYIYINLYHICIHIDIYVYIYIYIYVFPISNAHGLKVCGGISRCSSKLGGLGAILAPSWGVLGASWLQLGGSWGHLGSELGGLGAILEVIARNLRFPWLLGGPKILITELVEGIARLWGLGGRTIGGEEAINLATWWPCTQGNKTFGNM